MGATKQVVFQLDASFDDANYVASYDEIMEQCERILKLINGKPELMQAFMTFLKEIQRRSDAGEPIHEFFVESITKLSSTITVAQE